MPRTYVQLQNRTRYSEQGEPTNPDLEQFATTMMTYVMVRLLQKIKFLESKDPLPWVEHLGLTTFSKNGVKVAVTWEE
jgi:hypothetical protein